MHVRLREPGAPLQKQERVPLERRATSHQSPRQPLAQEVCAPRVRRGPDDLARRADAMGPKKKSQKQASPVEDDSWVQEVYQRNLDRRAGLMKKDGDIWTPAAEDAREWARGELRKEYGVQPEKAISGTLTERIAKDLQQHATAYAREVLAAKPVRFDGPRGLKVIDGRPVQVKCVWG